MWFKILIISCIIGFFATYCIVKKFIVFFKNIGLVGIDIAKKQKPKIAEMGGVPVAFGFILSALFFIGLQIFLQQNFKFIILFPCLLTTLFIVFIYMLDDLTAILKKKEIKADGIFVKKHGFRQRHKFLFPLIAAIPIMAANYGNSNMLLPIIGNIDFGILYPLVLVPIGIFGASNAVNMLAGINGLEAGTGVVAIFSLSLFAYLNSNFIAASFGFIFCSCLFAFLLFNWHPAKIFPGDSLTYMMGTIIAIIAIIGNIEKFAVFIFILWFIEFGLKFRSKFSAESFGKLNSKYYLTNPYKKIYSLTHIFMDGKTREEIIVLKIILIEIFICVIGFVLFL